LTTSYTVTVILVM